MYKKFGEVDEIMLPQTEHTISAMQAAGFNRNEFSVCIQNEQTHITLLCVEPDYIEPKIPAILENGINVTQIYGMPNHITSYFLEVAHSDKGTFKHEYGMSFC